MKKRIFVVIILIVIFITITVLLSFSNKSNDTEVGSEMAIMVQNESNKTQYDKWEKETWPDESQYQLNTTKSKCNNTEDVTNILSYSNNNILLTTNKTYRCNLYFDRKKEEPLEITKVEVDTSEYYTVKLTVHTTGGDGNYTYSVENTCTECGETKGKCGTNVKTNIIENVITITGLEPCYTHSFKIIAKDSANHQTSLEQKDISVVRKPAAPNEPVHACISCGAVAT